MVPETRRYRRCPGLPTLAFPQLGDCSTGFVAVNRGKRSIAVDLKSRQGRAAIPQLEREGDVGPVRFR